MRFRLLLLVFPALLLAACATAPKPIRYYHLSVLNRDGSLVAAWTAKGEVIPAPNRFNRFIAVEHTLPHPWRTYRYPLGWKVNVSGPNVVIYRVEEPEWLRDLAPEDVADQAEGGAADGKTIVEPAHL